MIAQESQVSQERLWNQLIAQVWSDENFKQRLLTDPRGVLSEFGIELKEGIEIRVVEDTDEEPSRGDDAR